jgi:hypothetical protein
MHFWYSKNLLRLETDLAILNRGRIIARFFKFMLWDSEKVKPILLKKKQKNK